MASKSFKSVGDKISDRQFNREFDPLPFGIKTPLRFGTGRSGIFDMHYGLGDQIHDNLRNLLLTNHGERLGHYEFGANLRALTTERLSNDSFDNEAMIRIRDAVSRWMPFINLDSFDSSFKSPPDVDSIAEINIRIFYSIPKLKIVNKGIEVILHCIG